MCDADLLRLLADQRGRSVAEITDHFHVTQTAIRGRLVRLSRSQSVTRQRIEEQGKRGRPKYLYFITPRGAEALAEAADEASA
jgi:predicted ArsR family transcriptional regulator